MDISNKIEHRFKDSDSNLYASHEKVHTREVKGVFQTLRNIMMMLLLGLYYGLAWFNWDGHQAVLFDLPERQFHIFFLTFWPQDFFFLAWLLIMAALSLFFFTALAGRLWCGYACPQTVWTEIFIWMERLVEGDRNAPKETLRHALEPRKNNQTPRKTNDVDRVWLMDWLYLSWLFYAD